MHLPLPRLGKTLKHPLPALLVAGLFATSAAAVEVTDTEIEGSIESEELSYRVVQVVSGLEHPWAVNWLPDGRMLVTERPGRMLLIDSDEVTELDGLPEIDAEEDQLTAPEGGNQGGLLDVMPHPQYADNGWIYFTYSSPGDDDSVFSDDGYGTGTALARARINDDGDALEDLETLYAQVPRTEPGRHYGSRILFPGDGTVMFSIGDRGIRIPSQDLTDPGGSMIRLNEDGGAADDNPFIGTSPGNIRPEIFSFGHRNNQGLAMHPETGEIWTTEHGPYGGDMLHRIEAGANYGWPQVAYGAEYDTGEFIGIGQAAPGVTEAVHWWEESMAPSGLAIYQGDAFPAWEGHLFAGSLLREQLHRLELGDDGTVSHEEVLLDGVVGRIRDVRLGPDGMLYVVTDESDGGVYRLESAD
ncbi:MAG: PQQ-dependent sugar dehydrogenase [Ectothiorhodospiraceae bacterium]|nr:PQQ-dependent sugar dehydrogenase [Ectothiorhodospiraceae bacterium]